MENHDYQKINILIKEVSKYIKREDHYRASKALSQLSKYIKNCRLKKD